MSAFDDALEQHFPGALPAADYLSHVQGRLDPLDFDPQCTLPLVCVCRDELTASLVRQIERVWGPAFSLAGLGGVPFLGRTGWQAALGHIPDDGGRGHLVVFGFPHIGIDIDGTVGAARRPGQSRTTSACGALSAIFGAWSDGRLPTEVDDDDFEATRLALRLVDPGSEPTTLVDLTISAAAAIEIDLWAALDDAAVAERHDVAVWCGVQVHGPGGDDWVWPGGAGWTGADGQRRALPRPVTGPADQ